MLKDGAKVTVHFINHWNYKQPTEIKTDNSGKVYKVKTIKGKQGIDGNERQSPTTCNGETFTPFTVYAHSVIFKNVRTGKTYRMNSCTNTLEETIENNIKWL